MHRTRVLLYALLAAVFLVAPAAHGASSAVVVSQVYAGGGNTGALYQNDFVELLNRGATTVDVAGWTVQYATATGTSWTATPLTGSIAPGGHYLVQLASAAAIGSALPAPDASDTTNLASTGGKIALVAGATPLACGATAGSCASVAAVQDLVGYGTATDYEGTAPAPALSSTLAAVRAGGGCTDTNANDADFAAAAPLPHNSASASVACGGGAAPSGSQTVAVAADVQSVLSLTLEKPSIGFGSVAVGSQPAPIGERVTVVSTATAGYALSAARSSFAPADLPLGIASSAPAGGQLAAPLTGGALASLPISPAADLLLGTSSAPSAAGGDVWPTSLGFVSPLGAVPPGHYTSTVTYTVIAR